MYLKPPNKAMPRRNSILRVIYETVLNIGQSVPVDPVDERKLARRPSPKRSVRLRGGVHGFDAGRNRTSEVLCAKLEAASTDRSHNSGSARKARDNAGD